MESQQQQQLSYGMPYPYQATVLSPPVVRGATGIGVTLIALGVLSIIANAVGLGVTDGIPSAMFFFVGHGIWNGIWVRFGSYVQIFNAL